jgi:hypothetical protein
MSEKMKNKKGSVFMKKAIIAILVFVGVAAGIVGGKMLYDYNKRPKWIRVA